MSDQITKDWALYESGKKYNERLEPPYYETVNANIDFHAGNQWRNSEASGLMKPVFNIIKRVLTFFVASLTTSKVAIQFEPLTNSNSNSPDEFTPSDLAGAEIENLFEKFMMENRIRDALTQAAVKGDVAAHIYFDPAKKPYRGQLGDVEGEICFELVSGTNVFFGNANNPDVAVQPYIIISGRDMVSNLQAEAKRHKEQADQISEDTDYHDESGEAGQIEVEADGYGKALYVIKYERDPKTQRIKVSKSVRNAYVYKDIDTGLDYYPIAWLPWEKQDNQYHGRALVTGIIPNQIFINKMFAMVMYNLMMTAFPKAVYNADYINGWSNEIGTAIGVRGVDINAPIKNLAGYLEAGNMSSQITQVIEMAMSYTKDTLGISDVSLGNVKPNNTSAIIAVQKSTVIPLENIRANMYEWLERIAQILVDMMGTYYGNRPVVVNHMGQRRMVNFDFNIFKGLWLNAKVDIGESSYWSQITAIQTLDNLLNAGHIDIVMYLERLPDGYIANKQEMINEIKEMREAANKQPQYESMAQWLEQQPPEIQQQIMSLPPEQQEQAIQQMMSQAPPMAM